MCISYFFPTFIVLDTYFQLPFAGNILFTLVVKLDVSREAVNQIKYLYFLASHCLGWYGCLLGTHRHQTCSMKYVRATHAYSNLVHHQSVGWCRQRSDPRTRCRHDMHDDLRYVNVNDEEVKKEIFGEFGV